MLNVFNQSPDSVQRDLRRYLNAIQAMGSGVGLRAMRYRKDAQEAMTRAYRPLLKFCRQRIEHAQQLDYRLVSSLERDPLLKARPERLRTVPGVGSITALTWALEVGDFSRFASIKEAISYCGLCSEEKSSGDKVMRIPLSKQRNKHIQRVLIEAAKLAVRQNHELALVYDKELQRGNPTARLSPWRGSWFLTCWL